jgi:hypothetical protein
MGFDQKGAVVFRISRGENDRWDVLENDFEKPLASFDDQQDACDYANKLSMTKEGSTVMLLDEGKPASPQSQNAQQP